MTGTRHRDEVRVSTTAASAVDTAAAVDTVAAVAAVDTQLLSGRGTQPLARFRSPFPQAVPSRSGSSRRGSSLPLSFSRP